MNFFTFCGFYVSDFISVKQVGVEKVRVRSQNVQCNVSTQISLRRCNPLTHYLQLFQDTTSLLQKL